MERAEQLYREHERLVRAVCERMVGRTDAQDIVQDAFVRALTHPPEERGLPLKPWLVKVARNLAIDHLRRRRRVDTVPQADDVAGPEPTGESPEDITVLRQEGVAAVLVACEALPPTERGVVLLRDLLDLTTRETASVLGLSDGSVKVLHLRARKTLARYHAPGAPERRPARMSASTVDALERFVSWLTAREVAGFPVRAQAEDAFDGMADPALSSAGVIRAQTSILGAVVDAARRAGRPALLARALVCLGNLERFAGRFEPALGHLREAAAIADDSAEGEMVVRARGTLASTFIALGQDEHAEGELRIALGSAVLAQTGEEGALRCRLAEVLVHQRRFDEANEQLGLVSALLEVKDDKRARVAALLQRGHQALTDDEFVAAMALWDEALELNARLGDRRTEAAIRSNIGLTCVGLGDNTRARTELWKAIALAREAGVPQLEAIAISNLALAEQDDRDLDAAARTHGQALALYRELGNRRSAGLCAFNAGVCALLRGRRDEAAEQMAAGRALIAEGGPDVAEPYLDLFEAAARLVDGDPAGLADLEEVRREAVAAGREPFLHAVELLLGIPEVHAGDLGSARARLERAIPGWVEVRTAAHLLENALGAARPASVTGT